MIMFKKIIVIVAIAVVRVPTHSRGNVVFVTEPLVPFGTPHMPLYTEKVDENRCNFCHMNYLYFCCFKFLSKKKTKQKIYPN